MPSAWSLDFNYSNFLLQILLHILCVLCQETFILKKTANLVEASTTAVLTLIEYITLWQVPWECVNTSTVLKDDKSRCRNSELHLQPTLVLHTTIIIKRWYYSASRLHLILWLVLRKLKLKPGEKKHTNIIGSHKNKSITTKSINKIQIIKHNIKWIKTNNTGYLSK